MHKTRESQVKGVTPQSAMRGRLAVKIAGTRRLRGRRNKSVASPSHFDPVHHEYSAAVEMIHTVLASEASMPDPRVRYWVQPFSKVSGDFFCHAVHDKRGWFGLFADAAGHGLPAAIYALHIPVLFREAVLLGMSLAGIYDHLNRFLMRQQVFSEYVCGALVHIHEREIAIINAGVPEVLLTSHEGRVLETFGPRHFPMGIQKAADEVEPQRYRMARDEHGSLFLCSDGLAEFGIRHRAEGTGASRIRAALSEGTAEAFERLTEEVTRQVDFIHDDVSLALIPVPIAQSDLVADDAPPAPHLQVADIMPRVVENLDYGVFLTDSNLRIVYANPALIVSTGLAAADIVGQSPGVLSAGRQREDFYDAMRRALRDAAHWEAEVWNRDANDAPRPYRLVLDALPDDDGRILHFLGTFSAVETGKSAGKSGAPTLPDPLTGLPNRDLLHDRGKVAVARTQRGSRSLAVLFIDLDRFSSINESLGLDVGDEVLLVAARRMAATLRDDDTISRYGNDEFVCLLSDIAEQHDAAIVAHKVLAALAEPLHVVGHSLKLGASIGISILSKDCAAFEDLIVQASRAMQRSRDAGGNLVSFFDAETDKSIGRRFDIESRLNAAIDAGQLEVFLQPKVDLAAGDIIGAEALVRWNDPQDGLVSPGLFIPIAEKSDLISRIGHWVLNRVCRLLAERHADLPQRFHVAFNVSPKQFERDDVAGAVAQALRESGVPPWRLQLEVTESMFIRDFQQVAKTLSDIVSLGVSVALDDFGTGYSNLASLSRLPLHTFKLDQSLVRGVDSDASNASIARSVWHLADGLDKELVAEGIETCAECGHLKAMGYRLGQGFRFGKPMPEQQFFSHLEDWRPSPRAQQGDEGSPGCGMRCGLPAELPLQ
jgi:diguanylate cyclase (GGDEF)-like protein/PAS domain S-box-containing protein